MDINKLLGQLPLPVDLHVIVIVLVIGLITYFIYQITNHDYSDEIEQFSADIPLHRPLPPGVVINMKNFQFNPDYILIPINTEVTWINLDTTNLPLHCVKDTKQRFESQQLALNQTYTQLFDQPGTYYYTSNDPKMKGTIMVTGETLV